MVKNINAPVTDYVSHKGLHNGICTNRSILSLCFDHSIILSRPVSDIYLTHCLLTAFEFETRDV